MQSFKKTLGHENLFKKSYGVKMAQAHFGGVLQP